MFFTVLCRTKQICREKNTASLSNEECLPTVCKWMCVTVCVVEIVGLKLTAEFTEHLCRDWQCARAHERACGIIGTSMPTILTDFSALRLASPTPLYQTGLLTIGPRAWWCQDPTWGSLKPSGWNEAGLSPISTRRGLSDSRELLRWNRGVIFFCLKFKLRHVCIKVFYFLFLP